ncbi:hypothetical protein M1446_00695 [Candidatus Dependentiae bacterium]|nr:hypothetical protein [Candidatus Dependentiae bacterium]
MLDNCSYNKVKLMAELSKITWFLEKHAIDDAKKAGDKEAESLLRELHKDTSNYLEKLQKQVCTVSQ